MSLYLYLKIKPFVHQDEEKNVPFFLFYTISGENIKVKKNVLTNIQVESISLGFFSLVSSALPKNYYSITSRKF